MHTHREDAVENKTLIPFTTVLNYDTTVNVMEKGKPWDSDDNLEG